MSKVQENTITDLMAEYFRKHDLDVMTQMGSSIGGYSPDIVFKDDKKLYLCEAEWNSSKFEGVIQADNYSKLPESSGSFLILYPDSIKSQWNDTKKIELEEYEFRAYFFRRDQKTIPSKLYRPIELVQWIKQQLKGEEIIDIGELIDTLRGLVTILKDEMPIVEENMSVFNSVLGIKLDEKLLKRIAQYASSYLLMNQLLFYQVLSRHKPKMYKPIDENALTNPYEIQSYFDKVLDEDYEAIYSVNVATTLSVKSLSKIATVIKVLRALAIDRFRPDIVGKVFHSLIPLDIRKVVAAYFTKEYAADILAMFAIKKGHEKIVDFACGSGTLLVAGYQRKASLFPSKTKAYDLHRDFVEEQITGLDIMPFSAHLSTINLAVQQPLAETNFIRVGIFDSTNAEVGTEILPLREVVPFAERQRALDDFMNPEVTRKPKKVQEGAIPFKSKHQHSFKLEKVDAVMMNPPFTRQESIGKIGQDYKRDLLKKFSRRTLELGGRSSFYTFFVLIADKFLKEKGKMAFVLPATILAKESDQEIRTFLLKNYNLEAIIVRHDGYNFSENTTLTEILLLCTKEKPTEKSLTSYIALKSLDSASKSHVEYILNSRKANEEIENQNYRVATFYQHQLDPTNLFIPISVSDYDLLKVWDSAERSPILRKTKDVGLSLDEGLRSREEGSYPACGLSANDTIGLGSDDYWIIEKVERDNIIIKHRMKEISGVKYEIPKKSTFLGLRNSDNRTNFDVSKVEDRIMLELFKGFTELAMYCNLSKDNLSTKWKNWVLKRGVHLAVIETLHPEATNTFFFAYYSERPRAFSSKFWNVQTTSLEQAKVMTLWFNSSFNFIQLLKHRIPTGWFKIRGYVFENLRVPDLKKLESGEGQSILELFNQLNSKEFPAIWKQLARNIPKSYFSEQDMALMNRVFDDFESELGKGFEARRKIDLLFMKMLNIKSKTAAADFLTELYAKLLKEICLIKQSSVEA